MGVKGGASEGRQAGSMADAAAATNQGGQLMSRKKVSGVCACSVADPHGKGVITSACRCRGVSHTGLAFCVDRGTGQGARPPAHPPIHLHQPLTLD